MKFHLFDSCLYACTFKFQKIKSTASVQQIITPAFRVYTNLHEPDIDPNLVIL
jgi:hypothetical protein